MFDVLCATGKASTYIRDTNMNYLCPSFFDLSQWPTAQSCPSVVRNKFKVTGPDLLHTQLAAVIAGLAHVYTMEANAREGDLVEVYPIQDCADLDVNLQIRNAANYAMYTVCRCFCFTFA